MVTAYKVPIIWKVDQESYRCFNALVNHCKAYQVIANHYLDDIFVVIAKITTPHIMIAYYCVMVYGHLV